MKNVPIPYAIIIGCIFISVSLYFGLSINRYLHIAGKQILDKKEGTIYLLDEKKYILKNGDVYQYE
ncbi:MAG: hypothetical protein ACI9TK_000002 [Flavobacteriaceae bacterium]|jgi:hypothetical protein|tara:strand:- start:13325 stop:13522 length:198 start_codon:yes stop_codon:yes gene_type:complete